MDRNQVIGFSLIGVLLIAYFFYNQHNQQEYLKQRTEDSVAYAKAHPTPKIDSVPSNQAKSAMPDTAKTPGLPPAFTGSTQAITLENKKLSIRFTSKGAYPSAAFIKGYKTYYGQPLALFDGVENQLSAVLPLENGRSTADLYFTSVVKDEPNGDHIVDFSADLGNGKKADIIYTLPNDDYMMHCSITLTGMPTNALPIAWQTRALHTEKDITNERNSTQVYYYYKNDKSDYFTVKQDKDEKLDDGSVAWVGLRKQYFSSVLIAEDGGDKALVRATYKADDTASAAQTAVLMQVPMKPGNVASANFKWYIGPNDYKTLRAYHIGLDEMVPLGVGIMAFVKYINKFALIPIFYFLAGFIKSYVLIIVIMTIFIRVILSFFTYKSYLSAAKMRVLKPELDEIRKKVGDDQQKFSMEQMKLYRIAGVNPLGGCLPMVFQIPILLSMYYMFPSFIEFRQQHFLWANDLSVYDSILNLPFTIPFYGDHVSLFTLMMTATSLFLALFNKNTAMQDPNNPSLKYLPYIMPIIFLGVFNKMAAALTFYYTLSNLLSMTQQFVIQKYFINEKKIHAQIQENKNKPATPSKWAQRIEELQKAQQEKTKVQQRITRK
jgi:YidC/Oxa1 family membrane protein insertase